jgi:hypothetical protein
MIPTAPATTARSQKGEKVDKGKYAALVEFTTDQKEKYNEALFARICFANVFGGCFVPGSDRPAYDQG